MEDHTWHCAERHTLALRWLPSNSGRQNSSIYAEMEYYNREARNAALQMRKESMSAGSSRKQTLKWSQVHGKFTGE